MPNLRLEGLVKSYKGRHVVDGVHMAIESGTVVGLLGPNGAGKTTTFYMTVGMIRPDSGSVLLDDKDITDYPMYLRARRGIGYLPQEASVFRKLTVKQNVLAILEVSSLPKSEQDKRADELLDELGIGHLSQQRAGVLSGGGKTAS